jgi:radical SAM protein with 4Fe4S-binding SPASM domain
MDCLSVPEIGLDDWAKLLVARSGADRLPLIGSVELTHRCNLNCVQCYCNLPISDQQALRTELSFDEVRDILNQAAEEGCLWLLLTGGEPLVRMDFLDIYAHAKKNGMLVSLFTNGTLLNSEVADYLAEWPPRNVEITLHSASKETFERVTRVPGSYHRCMRGIELLLERDIPLKLKTTVTTLNRHELDDTTAYAESLGVEHRFDALLIPRLDGSKDPYAFRLTPDELVSLDREDGQRRLELERLCRDVWGHSSNEMLYICGAGKWSFHVDPCGRLGLCIMNRAHTYDLKAGSFRSAWREFIPGVRSLRRQQDVECRTCPAIALCGQCPAWSYLEHRDLETPVEYLCEVAHCRAEAFRPQYERGGKPR